MCVYLFASPISTLVVYEETAGNKNYVKYCFSLSIAGFDAELTMCLFMFLMTAVKLNVTSVK